MSWAEISEDVFETLSLHVDRRQLKSLHLVNRHFRFLVTSRLKRLTSRQISVDIPSVFPRLEELDLSRCWNEMSDMKLIGLTKALGRSSAKVRVLNLSRCHGVTNRGIASVALHLRDLEDLSLSGCRSPSPIGHIGYAGVDGQTLHGLVKLKHLNLRWNPVTDVSFQVIVQLTGLVELDLGECHGLSEQGIVSISRLQNLQKLNLERSLVGQDAMQALIHIASLTSLSLKNCVDIKDPCLQLLTRLEGLTELNLSKLNNITDEGVYQLAFLPKLKSLDLSYCTRLNGNWILPFHWNLVELHLADCCNWVNDEILRRISSHMENLKILKLENCVRLSHLGLASLTKLFLKSLDLSFCAGVKDQDLRLLSKMNTLQELNLAFCSHITNHGLIELRNLTSLKQLVLDCCRHLTIEGIKSLNPLGNSLESLEIAACHGIDSEVVRVLCEDFKNIKNLNLSWLSIEDEQLRSLKKLQFLSTIKIRGCHELSNDVLKELWYLEGISHDIP